MRLKGDPVPVGVADADTDRGALPFPAEQLALGVCEPLEVAGMDELRVEGAVAEASAGGPPEDSPKYAVRIAIESAMNTARVARRLRIVFRSCMRRGAGRGPPPVYRRRLVREFLLAR